MKTKNTLKKIPDINQSLREHRRIPLVLVASVVMTLLALSVKAANILNNPGFEASPVFASGSWSQHATVTWSMGSGKGQTPNALVHTGNNSFWMQGVYTGGANGTFAAQDATCIPGNTYTADAWYSAYVSQPGSIGGSGTAGSGLFGSDGAGNEDGWVEVMFFNSANNLLADYKSTIIDPVFEANAVNTLTLVTNGNFISLPWQDFPVTNQYDPTTVTPNTDPSTNSATTQVITNTVGSGQFITAPAGAVKVEFRISLFQAQFEPGAPFWDDATLTQVGGPSPSVIGNLNPDGTKFFNGTNSAFTFNVTSAAAGGGTLPTNPTSGIGIVVNGQNQTGSLQFTGPSTNLSVTLPGLSSNSLYTITVSVTNSVGLTSSKTVNFDTFPTNVFIVSAEDYDYTNGQFFENPTPTSAPAANSYFGLAGVLGTDISTYGGTGILPGNGAVELIRTDGNVAMQKADDIQLPQYAAANDPNVYNVQIAFNNGGNWENYTRNYPTGNFFVYLWYNDNTPGNFESLNLLTSGNGTPTQTVTNLGRFISAGIGANYAWVPLTDTFGNKIIVNLAAGPNTLQLLSGGIANFVDFIFVPSGTLPPAINNLVPNNVNPPVNGNIFLNVPNITYSVSSAFSTVATNDIHTIINGVDVSSTASYTGNNTNWNVSLPCPQNQLLTLLITAKDALGASNQLSESFDTFSQNNLMIEGVDFDFNGGQFIDDPIPSAPIAPLTNSYYNGGIFGTNAAVINVDYAGGVIDGGEAWPYRSLDTQAGGQEQNFDFVRDKFATNGSTDYDLGFWNGGFWENYTRTIPTNHYNVYCRMAGGAGPFSGTTMSLVTSGRGTTTQTTQVLGSFADANAAGWGTWHWVPMRDTNGNLATVSLGGVQTVRMTSGNNLNLSFIMFVPSVAASSPTLIASLSGANIQIKFQTQSGHNYTVLFNTTLNGGTWQTLSGPIAGDGTIKTVPDTITTGGPRRFYRVQVQ